jgi:hypothetical protein
MQLETGRSYAWCNQICEEFKSFAFIIAKHFDTAPLGVVLGLAKQVIVQEVRDAGPDIDEEVPRFRSRKGARIVTLPLPPQDYAAEDVEHLAAV